jgi:UDP-N-acetylmuramoyl-tripeptide--D-alanyl-D-alanine ligase
MSPWRMDVRRTQGGVLVINDSYNANPASMTEALKALARVPATRRIAVIGPMLELGALAAEEHARIGALARELGISAVAIDAPAYGADDVDSVDAALDLLADLGEGDAVLVKASRAAGLERLAARLLGEDAAW